jgi:hypothetical protein
MIRSISLQLLNAKLSSLHFSSMVRPCGRGYGANNPPPPKYMAGVIQQFELNRQFIERLMAQFTRPSMNHQPAPVTLQEFMRLNPAIYRSSTQPLMLMTGFATSLMSWSLLMLTLPTMPLLHPISSRVPLLNGGTATGIHYLLEPSFPSWSSKLPFVPTTFLRE